MRMSLKAGLAVAGMAVVTTAAAQVTFYAGEGFHGPSFTADSSVWNMERTGFNDRASSAVVNGGSWEVCEHARFEGRCIVLQPGEYSSLAAMGMSNNISSVRPTSNVVGQSLPAYPQRWRSDRSSTYSYEDRSTPTTTATTMGTAMAIRIVITSTSTATIAKIPMVSKATIPTDVTG